MPISFANYPIHGGRIAVLMDRETGTYADHRKVRPIHYEGKFSKVRAPFEHSALAAGAARVRASKRLAARARLRGQACRFDHRLFRDESISRQHTPAMNCASGAGSSEKPANPRSSAAQTRATTCAQYPSTVCAGLWASAPQSHGPYRCLSDRYVQGNKRQKSRASDVARFAAVSTQLASAFPTRSRRMQDLVCPANVHQQARR